MGPLDRVLGLGPGPGRGSQPSGPVVVAQQAEDRLGEGRGVARRYQHTGLVEVLAGATVVGCDDGQPEAHRFEEDE